MGKKTGTKKSTSQYATSTLQDTQALEPHEEDVLPTSQVQKNLGLLAVILVLCLSAWSVWAERTIVLEEYRTEMFTMNTLVNMTFWAPAESQVMEEGKNMLYTLDNMFSVTLEDSELSQLQQNTGTWQDVSAVMEKVLYYAKEISIDTQRAYDPTIYPIVQAWGFTQVRNVIPTAQEIAALLPMVDSSTIEIDHSLHKVYLPEGMSLDLGGIVKGYAVDVLVEIMDEYDVPSASIDLGGNVYVRGTKIDGSLWNVGIQNPYGGGYVGSMKLQDKAIITSGGYQRYFTSDGQTYHHILDPRTGYPADSCLASVSIVTDSGIRGDALSTALFVMGFDEAVAYWQRYQNFDMILICDQGNVYITPGLEGNFSLVKGYNLGELQVIS